MSLNLMLHDYTLGSTPRAEVAFFARDSSLVALDLLGMYLIRHFPNNGGTQIVSQIREVAAYQGETESSSHGIREAP